ncbi:undecaprenyl-diphosphate phosphatase [Treponema zioleckii]|uniref:undecaprenyl-diphosphate phosphatase n=1 Tax=Treponema zioleckii TaxID=331680 RepID=UPI00168BBBDC|nr:undecaprenyl-diphosphate phosphatase [Treponema zioleckii]
MTTFQGIVLGVLQGIAEFLPISSSGHLKIAQHLFGLSEVPLLFDIFLHMATLAAVVLYYRRTILKLLCILFRWIFRRPAPQTEENPSGKTATLAPNESIGRNTIIMIILSTIVTGAIGIFTSKLIDDGSVPLKMICSGFLVTSILLILSEVIARKRTNDEITKISWIQALLIGLAQGIGTLPGISRSGITIAGAQFTGVDRATAGDYSFIVSIPAIAGAFILELRKIGEVTAIISPAPIIAGCAAAFAAGFLSLTWLIKLIRKGKLEYFAAYLVPAGILGIIFF